MKEILLSAVITFKLCALGLAQTSVQTQKENLRQAQEVEAVFAQFAEAFAKADTAVLESLIAADYHHINGNTGSVLDKTRWLTFVKTRHEELKSGKVRIDTYHNDELRIQVYGCTAVVTGLNTTIGIRDGKEWKMKLRFTNVWVERDGRWQRVAFHDSRVEAP